MTEAELQELCDGWRVRLRLQDWVVRVKMVSHADMMENKGATVEWNRNEMTAVVEILDPAQVRSAEPFPPDSEVSIVHELLHIPLATFWKEEGTPENLDLEQAITRISHALVALKREAHGREERSEPTAGAKLLQQTFNRINGINVSEQEPVPETTCARCGGWHQDACEAHAYDDCATCGYPIYPEDPETVINGKASHSYCLERREHAQEQQVGAPPKAQKGRCIYCDSTIEDGDGWRLRNGDRVCEPCHWDKVKVAQEQHGPPHASSSAYCPHADCQDRQCVEFRAHLAREKTGEPAFQCAWCERILPTSKRCGNRWDEDGETPLGPSCRECYDAHPICLCGPSGPGRRWCAIHNPPEKP